MYRPSMHGGSLMTRHITSLYVSSPQCKGSSADELPFDRIQEIPTGCAVAYSEGGKPQIVTLRNSLEQAHVDLILVMQEGAIQGLMHVLAIQILTNYQQHHSSYE
ncbi:unnamed protein product [Mycetohabitans rhizoxinica HKI 454]|uniref:Uncharacterized protein n=1 Tax=Mycetohabitans rhizoxinica (strain DSM 19002 / CIP 109453 / HKI 454) TaxID=882378 RepID=E5AR96_MYCRK|nr:unnamed protein product [Mycetohabitans rhizoxinica HKI 454]